MTLKPVNEWQAGSNSRALKKIRAMLGMSETVEGYLSKIFPGWNNRVRFSGKSKPGRLFKRGRRLVKFQ